MRPHMIVKVDPSLCGFQKVAKRPIAPALGYCLLEHSDETFCVAIVSRRARSTHGTNEAFFEQSRSGLFCSILASLIGMENRSRDIKVHLSDRRNDQLGLHAIIKSQRENMPGAFPQGKTAPDLGFISELHFKDVRKDHLWGSLNNVRYVFHVFIYFKIRNVRYVFHVFL